MNRRRFLLAMGAAGGLGAGGVAYARFVEPKRVQYTEHSFPGSAATVSPAVSIAQISDLHLKELGDEHQEIASEVARREPEMVVFTGDSVENARGLPLLADFLALLPYGVPKFAILGNWEHWGRVDVGRLRAAYERANGVLLVNGFIDHRARAGAVRVSGVDDLVAGRPDLNAAIGAAGAADLHILLAHCPAHRDRITTERAGIDLVLSGHTHGGQVQILGRAPWVPRGSGRYLEGWYRGAKPPMYVSRGIGTAVLPIRFGARPEVSFFT